MEGANTVLTQHCFDLTEISLIALGQKLAGHLIAGDCLTLMGPIGAGKTTLARAIIQSALKNHGRVVEDIPSPTYTLVQIYDLGGIEIWHFDLYRLSTKDEAHELGLFEAMQENICLIEWPERLGSDLFSDALALKLSPIEKGKRRRLSVSEGARLAPPHFDFWQQI